MPRIKVSVAQGMGAVASASAAGENAANWAAALMQRVWEHGLEIDLVVPESVRAKLAAVPIVGRILVAVLDALDGIELRITLGGGPPKETP